MIFGQAPRASVGASYCAAINQILEVVDALFRSLVWLVVGGRYHLDDFDRAFNDRLRYSILARSP